MQADRMGKETVIIVRKFKNIFCFSFGLKKNKGWGHTLILKQE